MTAANTPFTAAATSPRLGRVHTIRIPDPLWEAVVVQAAVELRRDGASEIIREIVEAHVRQVLADAHIRVGRLVTIEDAEAYARKMSIHLDD